jgi:putative oxidoreductase
MITFLNRANRLAQRATLPLGSLLLLATRMYVSWQFLKSGWLKLTAWDTTLFLFHDEYHTPLLSPAVAAVAGTFGELVFPALLIVGLFGRYAAAGLFAVNVVAVVSYSQVLLSDGFEAALGQHILWGFMLLVLVVFGTGRWALDSLARPELGPLEAHLSHGQRGRSGSSSKASTIQS